MPMPLPEPAPAARAAAAAAGLIGSLVALVADGDPDSDEACTPPSGLDGLMGLLPPPPLPAPPLPLPRPAGLASAAGLIGLAAFLAASPPSLDTCWPICWAACPSVDRGLFWPRDWVSGP